MDIRWSSHGRDVHLGWDRLGGSSGLAEAVRSAIRAGRLVEGDTLPSTRSLADDLGVARGTVSNAYAQLAVEGYLATRQGAASTVAAGSVPVTAPTADRAAPGAACWNLAPGSPDLAAFPRSGWLAATRTVLAQEPVGTFGYPDPRGALRLREALARYLGRSRGVLADPERIVVCAGYSHALSVLSVVLRDRGYDEMAFEDPSLWVHRGIARSSGQRIARVPVDSAGVRVSDIDSPSIVVTPAHQYPLGVTLSPHRRAELATWARAGAAIVVEDDYDGEFRFDRKPVGALQALAPEHVVYAGTASKTLAPALRLAWLVLPRSLVEPMRDELAASGWRGAVLAQLVLAELLASGAYDRQVRRMRARYRARRDRVLDRLPAALSPQGIAAGLHLVAELPKYGPGEAELRAAAEHASVAIETLGPHWMDERPHWQGLVVGYAAPADHAFQPALDALAAILGDLYG